MATLHIDKDGVLLETLGTEDQMLNLQVFKITSEGFVPDCGMCLPMNLITKVYYASWPSSEDTPDDNKLWLTIGTKDTSIHTCTLPKAIGVDVYNKLMSIVSYTKHAPEPVPEKRSFWHWFRP